MNNYKPTFWEGWREISAESARAEGYNNSNDFLRVWCSMHDPVLHARKDRGIEYSDTDYWRDHALTSPADRYDALAIRFEVVK